MLAGSPTTTPNTCLEAIEVAGRDGLRVVAHEPRDEDGRHGLLAVAAPVILEHAAHAGDAAAASLLVAAWAEPSPLQRLGTYDAQVLRGHSVRNKFSADHDGSRASPSTSCAFYL